MTIKQVKENSCENALGWYQSGSCVAAGKWFTNNEPIRNSKLSICSLSAGLPALTQVSGVFVFSAFWWKFADSVHGFSFSVLWLPIRWQSKFVHSLFEHEIYPGNFVCKFWLDLLTSRILWVFLTFCIPSILLLTNSICWRLTTPWCIRAEHSLGCYNMKAKSKNMVSVLQRTNANKIGL